MSKLATYTDDDDSDCLDNRGDADYADQHRRIKSADSDKNMQPSTGRTEAVSEFSNLAGLSATAATTSGACQTKKTAAADDRPLALVSSYSTAGYAGWSKFCLAVSDGEGDEDLDIHYTFGQTKQVRGQGKSEVVGCCKKHSLGSATCMSGLLLLRNFYSVGDIFSLRSASYEVCR